MVRRVCGISFSLSKRAELALALRACFPASNLRVTKGMKARIARFFNRAVLIPLS